MYDYRYNGNVTWLRTNAIIRFRYRRGKCKGCVYPPTKMRTRSSYPAQHSRQCKCQLHIEKRPSRESTNLDASTVIPTIPRVRLMHSKMTPQRRVKVREKRYKGLESWLVDESDKKFIRRSVGAALPHRWRCEQRKKNTNYKWRRRDEE